MTIAVIKLRFVLIPNYVFLLQFGEVNNNKAKYFSNLSQSFEKMIDHITVQDLQRHTHKLKKIVKDIVDVSSILRTFYL